MNNVEAMEPEILLRILHGQGGAGAGLNNTGNMSGGAGGKGDSASLTTNKK